jgi:hypothetical protein
MVTANACHKTPVLPNRRRFPPTPERPPPSRPQPHACATGKRRLLPPGPSPQTEARQGSEPLQRRGQRRSSLRAQIIETAETREGAGREGAAVRAGCAGASCATGAGGCGEDRPEAAPHALTIVPPPTRVDRVQGRPSARAVAGRRGPSLFRAFTIATQNRNQHRHVTTPPPLPPRQQPRSSRRECACARLSLAGRAVPLLKHLRSACRAYGSRWKRPLARKWRKTAP